MAVPLKPQPYEDLRKRFPRCLQHLIDARQASQNLTDPTRASNNPDHVFDTFDGFRLIVSLDKIDELVVLHASMSVWNPDAKRRCNTTPKAFAMCLKVFKRVAGLPEQTSSVAECKLSPKGVVHLMFPLSDELLAANTLPVETGRVTRID